MGERTLAKISYLQEQLSTVHVNCTFSSLHLLLCLHVTVAKRDTSSSFSSSPSRTSTIVHTQHTQHSSRGDTQSKSKFARERTQAKGKSAHICDLKIWSHVCLVTPVNNKMSQVRSPEAGARRLHKTQAQLIPYNTRRGGRSGGAARKNRR